MFESCESFAIWKGFSSTQHKGLACKTVWRFLFKFALKLIMATLLNKFQIRHHKCQLGTGWKPSGNGGCCLCVFLQGNQPENLKAYLRRRTGEGMQAKLPRRGWSCSSCLYCCCSTTVVTAARLCVDHAHRIASTSSSSKVATSRRASWSVFAMSASNFYNRVVRSVPLGLCAFHCLSLQCEQALLLGVFVFNNCWCSWDVLLALTGD